MASHHVHARLHAARVAFAKVRKDRELFEAAGIGPGDSYLVAPVIENDGNF
jgi:hypothetical protein